MFSAITSFISGGEKSEPSQTNAVSSPSSPVRALPGSWYTEPEMFEMERRSIWSRRWIFLTASSRLKNPGDWLRYNIAGFDIIVDRDRKGAINAFHNVCRHRAYPVIENKEQGNAKILACRYHGWSYGLDGKLAKAPKYQTLTNFDKEQNALFRIHVYVDVNGFIWINLDGKPEPEVSWERFFKEVDKQAQYQPLNFSNYELDHTYTIEAKYNWKLASDNFNECYHCPTTHPDIPSFLNVESFDSNLKDGHIQHQFESTPEMKDKGLEVASTYFFPATSMSVSPHFMMIQKFLPVDPRTTNITYEIYRNKSSSDDEYREIAEMYARVMQEDKVLCTKAQENIDRGVFVNGLMHPRWEKAPLFFQDGVREAISEHFQKEKVAGKEIWPARQQLPSDAKVSLEDQELCEAIMCSSKQQALLAW